MPASATIRCRSGRRLRARYNATYSAVRCRAAQTILLKDPRPERAAASPVQRLQCHRCRCSCSLRLSNTTTTRTLVRAATFRVGSYNATTRNRSLPRHRTAGALHLPWLCNTTPRSIARTHSEQADFSIPRFFVYSQSGAFQCHGCRRRLCDRESRNGVRVLMPRASVTRATPVQPFCNSTMLTKLARWQSRRLVGVKNPRMRS